MVQTVNDDKEEKDVAANKKLMQDNLSNINNTIKYLKQNLVGLISSSSMISGLKQVR